MQNMRLLLCLGVVCVVSAFPQYQDRLPNGANVIRNGIAWPGVGHESAASGGPRNSFGNAFERAGYTWTPELCMEDSDGDGQTNGVELGDPDCVWSVGATPARVTDVSHPGFSDSFTSASQAATYTATSTPSVSTTHEELSSRFCPTLHADFLRRQQLEHSRAAPFNETHSTKHTPYIILNGTTGVVKVGTGSPYHPMVAAPGPVHFITHIYVLDQDGAFVVLDTLDPSNTDKAQITFTVPAGATQLRAYEWCNLHGLFEGPAVSVIAAGTDPAACAFDEMDISAQPSFIADLYRRQQLAWGSPPFTEALGAKHTPYITTQGALGMVTVGDGGPYHPMSGGSDPSSVHFVTHIYVVDQNGNVVTMQNLDPSRVSIASISFAIPSHATSLTAYEFCNLHGLWRGPTVVVNLSAPAKVQTKSKLDSLAAPILGAFLGGLSVCACITLCWCTRSDKYPRSADRAKSKDVDPEIGTGDRAESKEVEPEIGVGDSSTTPRQHPTDV